MFTFNRFSETLKIASALNQAVIVPKNIMHFPARGERLQGTIDVWWIVHDGGLLMLLPWLLRQHKVGIAQLVIFNKILASFFY